jgi:hypothetical protein
MDVLKPLSEYVFYMVVGQGIVDNLPLFLVFHQIGKAQALELVGNCRFGHAKQYGYVADAHFLAGKRP